MCSLALQHNYFFFFLLLSLFLPHPLQKLNQWNEQNENFSLPSEGICNNLQCSLSFPSSISEACMNEIYVIITGRRNGWVEVTSFLIWMDHFYFEGSSTLYLKSTQNRNSRKVLLGHCQHPTYIQGKILFSIYKTELFFSCAFPNNSLNTGISNSHSWNLFCGIYPYTDSLHGAHEHVAVFLYCGRKVLIRDIWKKQEDRRQTAQVTCSLTCCWEIS